MSLTYIFFLHSYANLRAVDQLEKLYGTASEDIVASLIVSHVLGHSLSFFPNKKILISYFIAICALEKIKNITDANAKLFFKLIFASQYSRNLH